MAPHHLLSPEFCQCPSGRVLKSLSSYTDTILTITWGKGPPLSWSRNRFLRSYCVDNFKTSGASYWLKCVTLRRDAKRGKVRGRGPGKQFAFLSRPPSSNNWPLRLFTDFLRRLEDVGILKAQFLGTIKCTIMLCFIHLKDRTWQI